MFEVLLFSFEILLHLFILLLLVRNRTKEESNKYFLAFSLSILGWIVSILLIRINSQLPVSVWFARLSFVSTTFALGTFLSYVRVSVLNRFDGYSKFVSALGLPILVICLTPYLVVNVDYNSGLPYPSAIFGPLLPVYIGYLGICIVSSIYAMAKYWRKLMGLQVLRIAYLIAGMIVAGLFALMTNILLPILTGSADTTVLGPVAVSVLEIITTYSIVKDRLFGLKYLIGKLFGLLLIVMIPFVIYYLVTAIQLVLWKDLFSAKAIISGFAISIVFTIVYTALRNFVEKNLLPELAYGSFNPDKERDIFAKKVSIELNVGRLGVFTVSTISRLMRTNSAGVILFDKLSGAILYKHVKGLSSVSLGLRDLLQVILYWDKAGHSTVLVKDELIAVLRQSNEPRLKRILYFMQKHGVEVILPLNRKVQLNGVIILGKKVDNRTYTAEDINFLETLIVNASVAFGRSLLYQQVQKFSETLQQKVDQATKQLRLKVTQLQDARQKEQDMIDIMGHELRTPATIVNLNMDMMDALWEQIKIDLKDKTADERYRVYSERINDGVEREIKLINTLLASAKLDGKKLCSTKNLST